MNNVSTNKNWILVHTQAFVEPPPIPLTNHDQEVNNYESDYTKDELHRNPASSASDMYKYKVAMFKKGKP